MSEHLTNQTSLVKGIFVVVASYAGVHGVAAAFEAGRLQQPEVAFFMLAGMIGMSLGIREIALSPSVVRAGAWIKRSVMSHV